ncbi:MAG: hydrogenase expression protein [Chloroflexi bacterium]|nr:hydrogenase expression protein [Chloroflexota bacterium]
MKDDDRAFRPGKLPLEYLDGLLSRYAHADGRLVVGPGVGQDVAVIDMGDRCLVVKTDPITFATDQIGWYAVHVNANDIATSGARPMWMLNTILLPEKQATPSLVESIFDQIHEACRDLGITLAGGHTEVTWGIERPMVIGVLIGEVERSRLHRAADARPGDCVLLAKSVPIEGTALIARERQQELLEHGFAPEVLERARQLLFDPGISVVEAAHLAADCPGVHAMHDPTEGGLATGLHELGHAAGAGLILYRERVPVLTEGERICQFYGLDPLGLIASGALLISVDPEGMAFVLDRFQRAGIPCAHVADLVSPEEGYTMMDDKGRRPLPRYDADEITRVFASGL